LRGARCSPSLGSAEQNQPRASSARSTLKAERLGARSGALLPFRNMVMDLNAPQRGCLLLADITGYTKYMSETELAHSQNVIADLLETIVDAIEPTFELSKLEGDAAFAHARADSIGPSMMMDTVEAAYFAFQKRLRDIAHSTTCECDACILIPNLDLKFFIHDAEYIVQRIARSEELTGPDVILIHRLAKGTSGAKINAPAFAVYTRATLDSMAMDPSVLGFVAHTESFDDIGDIEVFVQDLTIRWTFEQERNRDFVKSSEAVYENTFETDAPPPAVWDHLTDPTKRPKWQRLVSEVLPMTDGRPGVGTINHCMHGPDVIIEHVADWRPFTYITLRYEAGPIKDWAWTYQIDTLESGSRLTMRLSDPGDGMWAEIGPEFTTSVDDQARHLKALLDDFETASTPS
ncbi:MAG: DUF2652 domain-containing protein, partial [Acidimicrobiia bacterium]